MEAKCLTRLSKHNTTNTERWPEGQKMEKPLMIPEQFKHQFIALAWHLQEVLNSASDFGLAHSECEGSFLLHLRKVESQEVLKSFVENAWRQKRKEQKEKDER